jgi:aminoglycoside N3'-acetyltransferase
MVGSPSSLSLPLYTAKTFIKRRLARLKAEAVRLTLSYSTGDLRSKLGSLGLKSGDAVLVHAAFNPFNGYQDGPHHLIDCIVDVIGPRGHLFMMSMPYSGASRDYVKQGTAFEVNRTPSRMGLVSECFRRSKGVVRSANPLHPVLGWGPRSKWLIEGHEKLLYSCGKGSPFERMLELDTKALMFDVDLNTLTFVHYLEDQFQSTAPTPLYTGEPLEMPIIGGVRSTFRGYAFSPEIIPRRDFATLYDAFEDEGYVRRDRIGNTALVLVSLRELLAFATGFIRGGGRIFDPAGTSARTEPTRGGLVRKTASVIVDELRSGRLEADIKRAVRRALEGPLAAYRERRLPALARRELLRDRAGLPAEDAGAETIIRAALDWLCVAQDRSVSRDGGVARHYSLLKGWSVSYPETTGYIAPTLLESTGLPKQEEYKARARRMLDWLVSIQFPEGGFPGGIIGHQPSVPVTFNTGQILIGLARGVRVFEDPRHADAMHRAARWLVETQDPDGCWRKHSSPFVQVTEHTYDTHTAWGLLEAARVSGESRYADTALANVRWAITHQRRNGWLGRCCLDDASEPLTHTIGYAQRGIIEAYLFSREQFFLVAAQRIADALLKALRADGYLAGRFRSDWKDAAKWACLTGTAQLAHNWLQLYGITGKDPYLAAGRAANAYVRRTVHLDGPEDIRGGVKGSFPVDGDYGRFEYPSWAAKFAIDANRLEMTFR